MAPSLKKMATFHGWSGCMGKMDAGDELAPSLYEIWECLENGVIPFRIGLPISINLIKIISLMSGAIDKPNLDTSLEEYLALVS